jgi:hypothetical protein
MLLYSFQRAFFSLPPQEIWGVSWQHFGLVRRPFWLVRRHERWEAPGVQNVFLRPARKTSFELPFFENWDGSSI